MKHAKQNEAEDEERYKNCVAHELPHPITYSRERKGAWG